MRFSRRQVRSASVVALLLTTLTTGCSTDNDLQYPLCTTGSNGYPVSEADLGPEPTAPDLSQRPEIATGYRTGMTPVRTKSFAVSTANPLATEQACRVLSAGGTAADALIVAQTVLGLVEPQASGIGGGAFLLYYDKSTGTIDAYDGRETAPSAATQNYLRWTSDTDHTTPQPNTRASGRSVGVPGVLRLLELAHRDHGRQDWWDLFHPAIDLADRGFPISARLAAQISASATDLARDDDARGYFLQDDGTAKPVGTLLTNPALAKTLNAIAAAGADAFYTGANAADIVDAVATNSSGRTPGLLSTTDLNSYQAKKREVLCVPYRTHEICGMPAPSSGGTTVAATLGILSQFDLAALQPTGTQGDTDSARNGGTPTAEAIHLISEAERLAYADRDKYLADPEYVPLPGNSPHTLLDPRYLAQRAQLINPHHSLGTAPPGDFGPSPLGTGPQLPEHGTTHISIVDKYGNAASMTSSVESAFGSFHFVNGFLLNNQLTDFAPEPADSTGAPIANRIEPGKRPRSSMAPTLVFDRVADGDGFRRDQLRAVTGSPGGSVIIQYVVKTLVALLDWGLNPQQAVSLVTFGAGNSHTTNIGGEAPAINTRDNGAHDPLIRQLRQAGHQLALTPQSSGASAIMRDQHGWIGGADPRREGAVLGDIPR
ncbi:gamma-glutamyltransferase family protein [Nocardia sp. 2]|uniref:Gamma-glutamyltransferase family protein n=1 Tax=Nocardia acididurans TaxID=2802282 RepID=A0ABS1MHH4_9NOCA|nr:gamma-glutamyltransferase family protein [Nocardia acididurans]MBL1080120.1 gamma-glutamyltransferase family protein [Nocardia acididurans]